MKICGITNERDALFAAGLGADAVGFIFAPSSRQLTPDAARDIVRRLPPEVLSVGVFRNESPQRVVSIAHKVGLRAVQLHGHETAEDTRFVAERVPVVIRAFSVHDAMLERLDEFGHVGVLIDSATPGSGTPFDLSLLNRLRLDRRFILAGGLDPDTVATAIATAAPWGVDVASGVESAPGEKDPVKVRRFLSEARAAFAALPEPPDEFDRMMADWTGALPIRTAADESVERKDDRSGDG